ncbi:TetR/AcrR family transcriptional regulator [Brachybacterium halotolerans subsp. kimchii]|uniref:TetR/AcrR family transcriptional regulator n=1 Tax=Brachybacterium halotolerans TaxID=2795215 RepID=UPI001E5DD105|nr:TetR/AcrR family transcriptional regulator [Brachybacterium halotolerans]UEJ82411.1 TetR/AcrR family transcriptional regulator [Brachybacterium halotolerans subsp. kimchii]
MEKPTSATSANSAQSARPRRSHAQARAEMREGILRVGGELLEKDGPAGLSVREIARGLDVASSAIYRHVSSRDDLLTLLLEDAFTDLADRVDAALADASTEGGAGKAALAALAGAMQTWAIEQPQRWALVYGTPVPGYAAPAERTTGPGTRVMARFMTILVRGESASWASAHESAAADRPCPAQVSAPGDAYSTVLTEGARELGVDAPPALVAASVLAWTGLVGLISAQLFGQLGADIAPHGDEMLAQWVDVTAGAFGLR